MARYNLLTDDERHRLFDIPTDRAALIRHYTLAPEELEFVLARRGDRNRLGVAVHLCLLRHPGFGLRVQEQIPDEMLRYLAMQLAVTAEVYRDYGAVGRSASNLPRKWRCGLGCAHRGGPTCR
jgi:TnpA family transposase